MRQQRIKLLSLYGMLFVVAGVLGACVRPTPATPTIIAAEANEARQITASPHPTSTPAPDLVCSEASANCTPTPAPGPPPTATPTSTPTPSPTFSPTPTLTPTPPPTSTPCPPDVVCPPTPVPTPAALSQTENILFLGTDRRESEDLSWRTDTMLLAAIDWQNNRVGVLSFPRDLWVEVPRFDHKRLNQVDFLGEYYHYPGGGFALLQDTFTQNFGIRIDHFMRLHRSGFVDIVDALGGVDVPIDCDLWELTPITNADSKQKYEVLYIPAGTQHFDGEQALRFTTFRYVTGDYDRARRQQVFLLALRNQLVSMGTVRRIPQLWQALHDYFTTDLGILDVIRLGRLAANIDLADVHAHVIGKYETEPLVLNSGAEVLVSEEDRLYEAIRNLFAAEPIGELATRPKGCPTPPAWAQTMGTPTPTPTPATG